MSFRCRRSIKLLPGIRINLGKRSTSISLGGCGANVMVQPGHKMRATVGLPGTGLSFNEGGNVVRTRVPMPTAGITWRGWLLAAVVLTTIIGVAMNNIQ